MSKPFNGLKTTAIEVSLQVSLHPKWTPVEALVSETAGPAEILRALLVVLDHETQWTKGSLGRTDTGLNVHGTNPNAISWCMTGALQRTVGKLLEVGIVSSSSWRLRRACGEVERLLLTAASEIRPPRSHHWRSIPAFNDDENTTYEDVRLTLKHALAGAEQSEDEWDPGDPPEPFLTVAGAH